MKKNKLNIKIQHLLSNEHPPKKKKKIEFINYTYFLNPLHNMQIDSLSQISCVYSLDQREGGRKM